MHCSCLGCHLWLPLSYLPQTCQLTCAMLPGNIWEFIQEINQHAQSTQTGSPTITSIAHSAALASMPYSCQYTTISIPPTLPPRYGICQVCATGNEPGLPCGLQFAVRWFALLLSEPPFIYGELPGSLQVRGSSRLFVQPSHCTDMGRHPLQSHQFNAWRQEYRAMEDEC